MTEKRRLEKREEKDGKHYLSEVGKRWRSTLYKAKEHLQFVEFGVRFLVSFIQIQMETLKNEENLNFFSPTLYSQYVNEREKMLKKLSDQQIKYVHYVWLVYVCVYN